LHNSADVGGIKAIIFIKKVAKKEEGEIPNGSQTLVMRSKGKDKSFYVLFSVSFY
jgi:hypothetical protein